MTGLDVTPHRTLLFAVGVAAAVLAPGAACADLYVTPIRSVQWLVDHSATICVAQYEPDMPTAGSADGPAPRVTKVLKGTGDAVRFPLRTHRVGEYWRPPHRGFASRLLFVSAEGELLAAVGLNRPTPHANRPPADAPALREVVYGVSEYGDLYLTEPDLFRAILRHLARPPARLLRAVDERNRTPGAPQKVWPGPDFPLDTQENLHQIVVDFHVARRTHYLTQLETGDLGERLEAVSQLALIDDVGARDGLRAAARDAVVPPPFYEFEGYQTVNGAPLPQDVTATERLRTYAAETIAHLRRR